MSEFRRAERQRVFMKMNISGPSGSGKTKGALRLAYGFTKDWTKIGVLDSENGSASLYADMGPFEVLDLTPPFTPESYIAAIEKAVKAGFLVLIIDSSTHEWSGLGGCVDINEKLAQVKFKGNTWSAWSETTPRHDKFVQTVLQSPLHIITCTRSKTETVMGDDKKVKKVGMKDIQREGWEYELTLSLNLERDSHLATPSKDRTEMFENAGPFMITEKTGEMIKAWCDQGIDLTKQLLKDTGVERTKVTDKAVKGAIDRYKAGDKEVIKNLIEKCELTPAQSKMIEDATKS